MYSGGADPDDVAKRMGLPADLVAEAEGFADCLVYPDLWQVVMLFRDMNTQWRVGMNGPVGLDYNVLPVVMKFRGVDDAEVSETFDDLQVMESSALELFQSRRG